MVSFGPKALDVLQSTSRLDHDNFAQFIHGVVDTSNNSSLDLFINLFMARLLEEGMMDEDAKVFTFSFVLDEAETTRVRLALTTLSDDPTDEELNDLEEILIGILKPKISLDDAEKIKKIKLGNKRHAERSGVGEMHERILEVLLEVASQMEEGENESDE